jgi:DNA-binding CsgD family transcriptional regulator
LDIHSLLMVGLALEDKKYASINFLRSPRREQFDTESIELVTQFQPHLIRAFELSLKLSETRQMNDGFAQSLDCSPHGIFLVDADARVRHANRAGEAIVAEARGLSVKDGILRAPTSASTRALHQLIESAGGADAGCRGGGAVALTRPGFCRPLSIIVAPLRSEHLSFFRRPPSVIVCATDAESRPMVPEERLRALFGFTSAEAKIAVELLAGCDPTSIAERKQLSVNTVRVHIARIMAKSDTNRQADLVRLLERICGAWTDSDFVRQRGTPLRDRQH